MNIQHALVVAAIGLTGLPLSPACSEDGLWLAPGVESLPSDKLGPFVRTASGSLLAIDASASYVSEDEGRTWSAPRPLFSDQRDIKVSNERALFRTREGVIIAAFMNLAERRWTWSDELGDAPDARLPTYVMRSLDQGRTWQDVQKLHEDWSGAVRDMIQTKDGRVIFTAMKMRHDPGRHAVLTYSSTDGGKTWKPSNLIDLGGAGHHGGVTEPTITELPDGRVWMLIRTNWGEFWSAYSSDGGQFWRVIQPSGIPASSAPGLLKRLSSGRLLLVWNRPLPEGKTEWPLSGGDNRWSATPVSNHREELSVALSEDNGKTWAKPAVIAHRHETRAGGSARWVAYPYVFEVSPGKIWITTMQGGLRVQIRERQFVEDNGRPLIASISKETLFRNRDGGGRTWFHPRACMMPGPEGKPVALMTLQEIGGSDYFGQVHWSTSADLGATWSAPQPIAALGRQAVPGRDDGLKAAVCDVTPQYHPQSGALIALGHVVFYKGEYFARNEQLARYPVYVTRAKDGTWSKRKILEWADPRGAHIYTNNCGQRLILPSGDVQMSFTFGPEAEHRMVAGVRAAFDGEHLKVRKVGPPLTNLKGRGLLEPSVTKFAGQFWITIRAEDNRGYVSVSDDGLKWMEKQAWAWEDGTPLEMSTTQQHWLTHSDGLFLVYTRKDDSNEKVIRWRSPLWVAQVDVARRCLIKSTERVVLPLVGDGMNDPDKVALMGNFNVTHASPQESWVTVGEWMPRNGFRGDVLLARIRWSKPNQLPLW